MDLTATYIITGCTGYVGNVLARRLMSMGATVVGLARSREKVARVFGDTPPRIVYGDIRTPAELEPLFEGDGPFTVIHTAAYVTIGEGSQSELTEVTVGGTANIVEACLSKGARLLHISSTEALPEGLRLLPDLSNYIPEPAAARPGYSRAKSEADRLVLDAVRERGLSASLLMIAGVLGPGDFSRTHMTQVIIDLLEGHLPASIDGGYNDFDIRDLADVLPAILEKAESGETYLFANRPDKINEVLSAAAAHTGRRTPPTLPMWVAKAALPFLWLGAKLMHKRPLYTRAALASLEADTDFPLDKVKEAFGYSPRPLDETVRDHVDFLVAEGFVSL